MKGSSVCARVPTNAVKDGRWPLSDLLLKVNAPSNSSFALNSAESHCVRNKQPDIMTASSLLQLPQKRNSRVFNCQEVVPTKRHNYVCMMDNLLCLQFDCVYVQCTLVYFPQPV